MTIVCPKCSAPVPGQEVNVQAFLARCPACFEVFSLAGQVPSEPEKPQRPRAPQPAALQVSSRGDVLCLTQRWFTIGVFFLLFFVVFWDGFLLVWYGTALTSKDVNLVMLLFPLGHLAVGVFLTYLCLAVFLNSTVLTLTRRDLTIRHAPLPWPGNRVLPVNEVEQFYTEEQRGSKGSRTYTLSVVLKNGQKLRLVTGLHDPGIPLYLEQTLEQWFGLEDRPVAGEMRR